MPIPLRAEALSWALSSLLLLLAGCDPVGEPITSRIQQGNAAEVIEPDAGAGRLDCDESKDLPGTVALYCFEEATDDFDLVLDSTGKHDGIIIGTKTRRVFGPVGLGRALRFSETNASTYVKIPDGNSKAWDLQEGCVSFWIRVDTCPQGEDNQDVGQGIITRDARNAELPGHFGIRLLPDCRWSVRIQTTDEETIAVAPEPLTRGRWTHLSVNFGEPALELYLDAELVDEWGEAGGIAGNDNPWVIGADTRESEEGEVMPPTGFLRSTAIDLVRISSLRRQFGDIQ